MFMRLATGKLTLAPAVFLYAGHGLRWDSYVADLLAEYTAAIYFPKAETTQGLALVRVMAGAGPSTSVRALLDACVLLVATRRCIMHMCQLFLRPRFGGGRVLSEHWQGTEPCMGMGSVRTRLDLRAREGGIQNVHTACDVVDRALEGSIRNARCANRRETSGER